MDFLATTPPYTWIVIGGFYQFIVAQYRQGIVNPAYAQMCELALRFGWTCSDYSNFSAFTVRFPVPKEAQ